jgi:hypothetical protein
VSDPHPADPLDLVPDPGTIHLRLGEVTRQAHLLRRLLRLALAARQERERREPLPESQGEVRRVS